FPSFDGFLCALNRSVQVPDGLLILFLGFVFLHCLHGHVETDRIRCNDRSRKDDGQHENGENDALHGYLLCTRWASVSRSVPPDTLGGLPHRGPHPLRGSHSSLLQSASWLPCRRRTCGRRRSGASSHQFPQCSRVYTRHCFPAWPVCWPLG